MAKNYTKYLVIDKQTNEITMIADNEKSANDFINLSVGDSIYVIEKVEMRYFGRSIIISIHPEWVCKILNGEKTLEIRKLFPKDYVGWVFIYVTKGDDNNRLCRDEHYGKKFYLCGPITHNFESLNGKVVAKFWCDKVEEITAYPFEAPEHPRGYRIGYDTPSIEWYKLLDISCLTEDELFDYLGRNNGYAIHISKLEVFDKPMLITMFRKPEFNKNIYDDNGNRLSLFERLRKYSITKAPQSWCYIEGE